MKEPDAYGTTFEFFSSKRILLKHAEFITIDTRIEVQFFDEVI